LWYKEEPCEPCVAVISRSCDGSGFEGYVRIIFSLVNDKGNKVVKSWKCG